MSINLPHHKADPFPFYANLRQESPVCEIPIGFRRTAWLVTRYDDVAGVFKDERFVKNRRNAMTEQQLKREPWVPGVFKPLLKNMLDSDPPDHTRLRALVQKAFTPRRIEEMGGRIQSLCDELLDAAADRGRMDLIADYALPLPTTVIAEMLGVPVEDRHKFHRWSSKIVALGWSTFGLASGIPAVWRFLRYIRQLIQDRRASPQDDLISALVLAEEEGRRLNEDELVAMVFLLLVAGHETTVNLIGNGTLALLENPDQLWRLIDEPALIDWAIEELLRYANPLETATERFPREDVEIAGVTIPQGSLVYAAIASANRDERQFPQADTLDIGRHPNKHLSFGLGIHFCLGAALARLEGQTAVGTLVQRTERLRLGVPAERLQWRRGFVLRGIKSLPIEFD